jgi:NADH:ubiquinone oxidoreductase subunit 6 (subunit J)
MAIIHGLLASNIITVFIIMVLKLKRKHFLKPRKININGIQLAIFILLIVLSLIFLLYHNVAQLNQLTKVIQKIENSSNVANITYFGFQLPTNIALIDFFLIPGIIIIIIIIILVFIRK